MSDSFVAPWTAAHQAPLSLGFPRQEYWSRLPFSSPGDLPDPGIELEFPALPGRFFTAKPCHSAKHMDHQGTGDSAVGTSGGQGMGQDPLVQGPRIRRMIWTRPRATSAPASSLLCDKWQLKTQ